MDQFPSKSARRAGAEFWCGSPGNGRMARGETYNPDGLIITAAHHSLPLGHALDLLPGAKLMFAARNDPPAD
jgi:rare lipoprotein A (peptidoglycan hydrolase)